MLHRDPDMRASINDLLKRCQEVFGVNTFDAP